MWLGSIGVTAMEASALSQLLQICDEAGTLKLTHFTVKPFAHCGKSSPQNLMMWKLEQTPTSRMKGAALPH